MANNSFVKTGYLTRFILRLDRFRISLWLVGLTFFTLIVPVAYTGLYENQQERDAMAVTMENPAMIAMVGPGNIENYTTGVMTAHQMLLITAVVVGIMSILLLTRHTRADEEDGLIEMIRSLPTGRLSYLNASLLVISGVSVALALITGFGLYALGIESMDLEGSLLYGAALGGTGLLFAGVTAVFAQLAETSRGTIGWSIAILLFTYLFRAITDVSDEALSWISPLGWVTKTEAYDANHWGPIFILIGVSVLLFILANYLHAIRDLERSFLPSKPGRRTATRFLQSPIGLAIRLQRTGMIAWAVGIFLIGISYGSVLGDMETFFEGNEMMEQMFQLTEGGSITEQFIPMLLIVMAIMSTIPPIMAMNKLRGEEKKDRLEHLLGRAVSRTRLMGGYVVLSVVNGFVMVSLSAIGLWSAGTAVMEEGLEFSMIYGASMSYFPAVLVMIGLAVFLMGYFPKYTTLVWLELFYSFIVLYLGGLMQFPEWVGKLSPFDYIPQVPSEDVSVMTLVMLTVIAIVLMVIGFIGFNKRDID
ncbi:ABC transporter permease [Paraliobacillus quinghaiensis]|uniref:ABC transporter permease n=1 Tax=Paraliobacillus quinghaiensis TaxID=470815 RepID=A0A917TCW3_9BACI|nr:ABC-2 transporter permease [Paraliobacillus quinghaiensis]GGM18786.1 ABC transporter permease [Paraliobacillus quinghaiensis]